MRYFERNIDTVNREVNMAFSYSISIKGNVVKLEFKY